MADLPDEQATVDHRWPTDPDQHVWGPWHSSTGPPKPTQYRCCVHPLCKAVEYQDVPSA